MPGAVGTAVNGINNAGQIVGEYFTSPNTLNGHGFVYDGGVFTFFDVPGAIGTYPVGINDAGQIVGGIGDGSPTGQSFIAEPTVTPLPAALPLFATGLGARWVCLDGAGSGSNSPDLILFGAVARKPSGETLKRSGFFCCHGFVIAALQHKFGLDAAPRSAIINAGK